MARMLFIFALIFLLPSQVLAEDDDAALRCLEFKEMPQQIACLARENARLAKLVSDLKLKDELNKKISDRDIVFLESTARPAHCIDLMAQVQSTLQVIECKGDNFNPPNILNQRWRITRRYP